MGGGIGSRECDGNNKIGRGEAKEAEDEEFPTPPGEEVFEHRDRALPVRALGGDSAVDRQGAEQREHYED